MPKIIISTLALLAAIAIPASQAYAAISGGGNSKGGSNARTNALIRTANNKNTGPIAANTDENWYLEFTPSYSNIGGGDLDRFSGATVSLGYRLTQEDKIQLELGCYRSGNLSARYTGPANPVIANGTKKMSPATMIPLLFSYSYCIPFWSNHFEFRLTPATGIMLVSNPSWNITSTDVPGASIHGGGSSNNIVYTLVSCNTYYFVLQWFRQATWFGAWPIVTKSL